MDRDMTFDEAVAIRTRSLSGEKIDADQVSAAVAIIQRAPTKRKRGDKTWNSTLPNEMLKLLSSGPVEKEEFYAKSVEMYATAKRSQGPYAQLSRFYGYGLIRQEVVLTDLGRKRLGMKS